MSKDLQSKLGGNLFDLSYDIEQFVLKEKNIKPNVDFYAASVYNMMNIPKHLFTPIFACSRSSGWCAHILEQLQDNRLIRPRSDYDGEIDRIHSNIDSR